MKLYREPVILGVTLIGGIVFLVVSMINRSETKYATVDHITPVPLQIGDQPIPTLPKTVKPTKAQIKQAQAQQQKQDNMLNQSNVANRLNQNKHQDKQAQKFAQQYNQLNHGDE